MFRRQSQPQPAPEPTDDDRVIAHLEALTRSGQLHWHYMVDTDLLHSYHTVLDDRPIELRAGMLYFSRPGGLPIVIDAFDEPLVHLLRERFETIDDTSFADRAERQALLDEILAVRVERPTAH